MEASYRNLLSFMLWLSACLIAGILWYYHPHDVTWWYQTTAPAPYRHPAGWLGAYGAGLLLAMFGCAAWTIPGIVLILGICCYKNSTNEFLATIGRNLCGTLVLTSVIAEHYHLSFRGASPGGAWGFFLYKFLRSIMPEQLMLLALAVTALSLLGTIITMSRLYNVFDYSRYVITRYAALPIERIYRESVVRWRSPKQNSNHDMIIAAAHSGEEVDVPLPETIPHTKPRNEMVRKKKLDKSVTSSGYQKPPLSVLLHKRAVKEKDSAAELYDAQARVLEQKLEQFGIKGKVVSLVVGPVVVLFEYQPHSSVPINKIVAREHDLALALQATSFRIIAPIPGKAVVGFETSRATQELVSFANYHEELYAHGYRLPLLIGVTTAGEPVSLDLATLPHLLVAGSTGSGKSVALHTLIVSMISTRTCEEVKLILIDPKRLEFAVYADIPHLLFPIVAEAKEAVKVLRWLVQEMDRRYLMLSQAGVTDVVSYRATGEPLADIVVVIDEWADLMMSGGKDAEQSLVRLAQMARAAGIHVIVATQRPSVDIITGLIKVNIPARIACKVTSKVDSRTIIDTSGAEKLLGKGDMLVMIPGKPIARMHGMYLSSREVQEIACHIRRQGTAVYHDVYQSASTPLDVATEDQELYDQVLNLIKSVDEISISYLQRKLRIGYNRSARMIDYLEAHGMILPSDGGKTRKVLHSKDI